MNLKPVQKILLSAAAFALLAGAVGCTTQSYAHRHPDSATGVHGDHDRNDHERPMMNRDRQGLWQDEDKFGRPRLEGDQDDGFTNDGRYVKQHSVRTFSYY